MTKTFLDKIHSTNPIPFDPPPVVGPMHAQILGEIIQGRRSVRKFTSRPIPEDVVRQCLDLALLAPNSSNLQPWLFIRVRDEKKRQALVEDCFSQNAAKTAQELFVCVARPLSWKENRDRMLKHLEKNPETPKIVNSYYEKLVPLSYSVGPLNLFGIVKKILFAFGGLVKPVPREPSTMAELKTWAVKSTALACENLMLALRAFGFDSCPMEGFDSRRVKKLFGLSRHEVVVMVIGAGEGSPAGVYGPRLRFAREFFVQER